MADNRTMFSRRRTLAKASSAIALATGLAIGASGTAYAQAAGAFEGSPTVISGGVAINRTTNTDTIRVDTDQAVINWTTNDTALTGGPINFLPAGRTAIYRNNPTAQNQFTVLNRIIPTGTGRAVQFNGTVISQLQTASGLVSGGNVWFYSPGGIVVGATGVIDVGGLVLTSLDPVRDGAGNFISPAGSVTFGPAASSTSFVQTDPGAQIRATPENSYIAMVAPTVFQGGSVSVNGSALYVGAEAATITFSSGGLFDIQVTTGTNGSGGVAIGHSGTTTGPASSAAGDDHRIYMVAVPRNNAITIALSGGGLGFDVAGAADVVGNAIILSSGYNVFGDAIDTSTPVNPAQQANISIRDIAITSSFNAAAANELAVLALTGNVSFAGRADLFGANTARVDADGATRTVTFASDLFMSANDFGINPGEAAQGGLAVLRTANSGSISIGGSAFLSASARGGDNFSGGSVGSGTGGRVDLVNSTGGSLQIAGDLTIDVQGFAGGSSTAGIGSNFGRGGNVGLFALDGNASLRVDGATAILAQGFGSSDFGSAAGTGGAGFGGRVDVFARGLGNSMRFGGSFFAAVDGSGGQSTGTGTGGAGTGGLTFISTDGRSRLDFLSNLSLFSFGFGGDAAGAAGATGGVATGGTASLSMGGARGIIAVGGNLLMQASANGGQGLVNGANGGLGTGGTAIILQSGNAGQLSVAGTTSVESFGIGGRGTIGGDGIGGPAQVTALSSGRLALGNGLNVDGSGLGGTPNTVGAGRSGNGIGSNLVRVAAEANGVINVTGQVTVSSNGAVFGDALAGVDGGNGTGGNASIQQSTSGIITINGDVVVSAIGTGDANYGGGDGIAGNGRGGNATISAVDSTITITGNATADARGFGGANIGGLSGGDGFGGSAGLSAGGTLAIGGSGTALADAIGGSSLTNGSGGVGLGGIAFMNSVPAGIFRITGGANLSAQGFGGNASGTGNVGGLGDGGTAQISAINGALTVDGITTLSASAFGGSAAAGASSGAALGGLVSLSSQGTGQITLNQDVFLSSQALSGNVNDGAGNAAGATGGTVNVFATGPTGAITVNGRLFADAITGVGSAVTGTIGDALGGTVELAAGQSGRLNLAGGVSLDATAFGGNSAQTGNGGNATGGRTAVVIGNPGNGIINLGSTLTMNASGLGGLAHTGNGGTGTGGLSEVGTIDVAGTLTFGGAVSMSASGVGGDSVIAGNGGNGTGGTSRLGSNNAQMTGGDLFIGATGRGGNGALGGRGGDATGGFSLLNAGFGTVVGLLDFDNAFLSADAFGGAGGAGADGATGGAGGAGGNAIGGRINAFGSARNGQLDIGNLQVTMNGFGGFGGAGGAGTAGLGGVGGAGGIGTGGSTQIGTISNTILTGPNPTPTGFMTMNDAVVEANGFGGAGGNGGTGTTGNGNGGAGGLGEGGDIFFATRGSLVSVDALTLIANGAGGTGGTGAVGGNGGNGISGVIGVESTEQFSAPTNRGRLVAGDILAVARGTGGTGTVNGTGFYETGSFFRAVNGDVTATRIVFNIGNAGDTAEPTAIVEDFVRISDATVNAGSSFTFITPGQLSVLVNNGSLSAGAVGLVAGTFVPDTVITAPTNIGTIATSALALQSSGNIIVTANLNATQDIAIVVPGTVSLGNITGAGVIGISGSSLTLGNLNSGNHINLTSTSGAITAGNLSAANFIAMTAANGLTLGVTTSNTGFVDLLVRAGNLTVGNVTAGTFISLEATNGSILASNLTSGAETDLDAIGSVTFGTVVTGLSFGVQTNGNITGGNIVTSGVFPGDFYGIGLSSQTGTIQVGTLTAVNNVGLLAAGAINTGAISTGASFIALGGSDIALAGPLTAGTGPNNFVYFGNASMASSLGVNFDPAPVFALTPVRTPGSVTIGGAVQGGNVLAGVGTGLNVNGGITATGGRINITANSVSAQNISSTQATAINATNGTIALGNIFASGTPTAGGVLLTASGTINAGTISTGTTPGLGVSVDGGGAVSIGGVTATGAAALRSRAASFTSIGAITAGTVNIGGTAISLTNVTSTAGAIAMAATAGNLAFGTLTSSANTQFTATGSVTGGNITAGTWIGTTVGGNMTLGNLRSTGAGTSPNGFSIGLGAQGAIVTGTIDSFGLLGIGSDDGQGNLGNAASITTGAITAGGSVLLRSNQGLTTAAITSTNEIRVRGGTVTTGALQATNAILAAATAGSLNTGNVTTGTSAALLAAQSVNSGAISTGSTGTTFIGNSSAIPATGLISAINLTTLLASTPVRIGGAISIGAPVSTGTLLAASNNAFSASGAITAGTRIMIDTANNAVFGGVAAAPTISVTSGDIAFSQAGGLGNANTNSLTLTNGGVGRMIIGGTTQSEDYVLDAGEISRLRAGNIVISSPNAGSSGIGIEIRGFTLNGSGATSGNNLNGSEGSLSIQTTSTIRVNGNAIFNSMATTNRVALSAGRVEINADTGGLFLNGSSPGGTLSISANNIHIAGAELLGRLAENVNFVGRDTALGVPITTSRPDGVIQASRLQFNVGSTLLIQNTGTSLLNAGFFGRVGSLEIVPRSTPSQSSSTSQIDLVIYGQLLDTGDIVRNGTSVRDLIFPRSSSAGAPTDGSISGFTSNSSVNGCLLSAVACGQGGITEESPTVVAHAGPPPPQSTEEQQAEREQEEAEAAAEEAARGEAAPRRPIMPPVTIVNTRRLGVEPVIDEPVTSGGNPNLQLDQALPDTGGQP